MTTMKLKKTILGAVVASSMFASAAYADVNVVMGGSMDLQYGSKHEDKAFKHINPFDSSSAKRRTGAFVHDTTLSFKILGHTDALSGFNYGGKIVFEADTSSSKYHLPLIEATTAPFTTTVDGNQVATGQSFIGITSTNPFAFAYNENRNVREAMLFVEAAFGRVEFGNTYGATKTLQIDAGSVAAGNGGVHGDSRLYVHPALLSGNLTAPGFYTNRQAFYHLDDLFLPVNGALPYSTELATAGKLSYYSPNFSGVQIGLTYIPDTDVHGTVANIATITKTTSPHGFGFENVIEGGLLYSGNFSDFDFQVSALAQRGNAKAPKGKVFAADRLTPVPNATSKTTLEDLKGYEFGFTTQFMGVGFAGSYGHQDGLLSTLDANKYYTVGAGYEMGPWGFSVNYLNSKQNSHSFVASNGAAAVRKAEFNNLVFDVAYTCQGLMPYISVAKFKAIRPENGGLEMKNSGTVLLLGTKLSF